MKQVVLNGINYGEMSKKHQEMLVEFAQRTIFWLDAGGSEPATSPIEEMMLMALMFTPDDDGMAWPMFSVAGERLGTEGEWIAQIGECPHHSVARFNGWELMPQFGLHDGKRNAAGQNVNWAILDFAIAHPTCGKIAIELDGHQWHASTKEQVARDKKRDRRLLLEGWHVLRFTGSEVYKNPDGCVAEVSKVMRSLEAKVAQ